MKKTFPILATVLLFTLFGVVAAQDNATATIGSSPTASPPPEPNYFGGALAIVALAVIFAIIIYGGYKMIRKWTRSSD